MRSLENYMPPLALLLRKAENEGVRFLEGDSSRLFED